MSTIGNTPGVMSIAQITDQLNALKNQYGSPVGTVFTMYGDNTKVIPGCLLMNGAAVTSTYPDLRAHLIAVGRPVDGSGNPLLPDMGGYFFRGWTPGQTVDSGRVFGATQTDAFQGHWHNVGDAAGNVSGARGYNAGTGSVAAAVGTGAQYDVNRAIGAVTDGVNGTPRTAAETRPTNITVTYWIKAYNANIDSSVIDLANLVNDVTAAKTRADLVGIKHATASVNPNTATVLFTGMPIGVKRITAHFSLLVPSASALPVVRLGSGGTVQSTGYLGPVSASSGGAAIINTGDTSGAILADANGTSTRSGFVTFERLSPSLQIWSWRSIINATGTSQTWGAGTVTLAGEPDRVQFTTFAGTALLNGTMNASWES